MLLTIAIIIWLVVTLIGFGPTWPIGMFFKGGCIGMILSGLWWALFISGLAQV